MVTTITFGASGNASDYTGDGWSLPENGFTWATGPYSTICLPKADYRAPTMLELRCAPHVREDVPWQRVILSLDGARFTETRQTHSGTLAFRLPSSPYHSPILTIEHPDAAVPHHDDGRELALVFWQIRVLQGRREAIPVADISAAELATGLPIADIAKSFESLGDNCELGLVQRDFGTEPLGLLRFSSSRADMLIEGIDLGFSDILDDLTVKAEPECSSEWFARNLRYGMVSHTFQYDYQIGFDEMLARTRKHIAFLARKLMSDLREGQKIFVFKNSHHDIPEAEAYALFAAIRRRGPGRLLWVSTAPDDVPVGTIDEIMPGFWRGYADCSLQHNRTSQEGWLAVLANALLVANGGPIIKEGT